MHKLRSWFLKSLPEEHFNEFRMEILKENISRIQVYSLIFLFVELCLIFKGAFNFYFHEWDSESLYKQLFLSHLIVFSISVFFTLTLFTRKRKDNPPPTYVFFELFFISFIFLWTIIYSITNISISNTIVPYIICCLGISIAFYLNTVTSFILYILSFVFLVIGLYYNCSDLAIFKELITDSSIVVLISIVISRIIYQNKIDFFLYQKKIEKEVQEKDLAEQNLQRANVNLENLVKQRTQDLISINEQLIKEIQNKQSLEQSLIKEKNTLHNIIECIPYTIAIYDQNGYYLRGNPAGLKLFMIEPPPDYCVFTDPLLPPEFAEQFDKLKKGETVFFPELNYNLKKVNPEYPDKELTLRTTMFPIKNAAGEIENYIQIVTDVTDIYNAEIEIKQSEEKYRLLVENMEEGIYATQNGIFQSVNIAMTKIFGYTEKELLGTPAWNLAAPHLRESTKMELFNKVKRKDTNPISVECIRKNGDLFFADISVSGIAANGLVYGIVRDISERKHAEEVLIESEEKYRLLIENISEIIYLLDIKGNITYISERFEKISDYKISDILGRPLVDFVFIDDLPNILGNYSKALSGKEDSTEFRLILKNGNLKFMSSTSKLIERNDGTKQLIGFMRDISEPKEVEKNLLMLESAINQSTDGIAIANMDGTLIYVNESWAKMHDYTREEMTGQNIKISHNDEQIIKDVNPFNLQVIKNGHYQGEVGHIKKDRTPFNTWMHTTLLKDKQGNPTGLIGIARDTTQRKRAEEQLRASEDKYRQLIDNAPSGILHVNLNGEIIDANKALLHLLGSTSIEQTKKLNVLTFSNLIEAGISQKLQECIATGKIIISEHRYTSKWGKTVYARIRFKPMYDIENNINGVQAIIDDITHQKEHETKQKESFDLKYTEAEKQKKIFIENISNAIKGPLNMILGFTNILKKTDLSEQKYKFIAHAIIEKSNNLLRSVNNITTASQLESKSLPLTRTLCSPEKIITELISTYNSIPESKIKKIDIRIAPDSDKKINIKTDEQRLTQVISELLDNAFKNTHYGFIEIGCKKNDEDNILFHITDTGVGISPNKQKDFFSNLQNISDTDESKTQGLGLYICKGIIEQLGGKIWMKSEEGRGTTFYFSLPIIN